MRTIIAVLLVSGVGCGGNGGSPTADFASEYAIAHCAKNAAAATCAMQMGGTFCGVPSGSSFDSATCEADKQGFVLTKLSDMGITDVNWGDYSAQADVCLQRVSLLSCSDYDNVGTTNGCYAVKVSSLGAVLDTCGF